MATRLQIDSGLKPVEVRPAARPVDAFVQTREGEELAQLARSLQQFAPALSRFAGAVNEREAETQVARGQQAARKLEEQRITYKEAVKQGIISASENPWFLMGAKQQFGRAAAGQYAVDLQAAIKADPNMQASTEPADFGRFEADFRKQWLEQNVGDNRDLNFEKGFAVVDGYTMDEARKFTAAAGARIESRAGERLGVIVGQLLDQHYKEGLETVSSLINAEMSSYLQDNPKAGRIANLRAIEAIEDWARVNYKVVGRADVEGVLKGITAGTGKLFGTHEAKEMLSKVEREIISMRGAAMNLEHAQEEKEEREKTEGFWTATNASLADMASKGALAGMDLTPLIAQLNKINPDPRNAGALQSLRESLLEAKGNDESFRNARMWVQGVDEDHPGQFLSMGRLASLAQAEGYSAQQFGTLVNDIQERDRRRAEGLGTGSKLLNDPMVNAAEASIRGTMIDLYGTNPEQNRIASTNAIKDFQHAVLQNFNAIQSIETPVKRLEYIQSLANMATQLHAPQGVVKAQVRAGETQQANVKTLTVFQRITENITEPDKAAVSAAYLEFRELQLGSRTFMSDASKQLFQRLGIPLDAKELKSFFLEWDRNY